MPHLSVLRVGLRLYVLGKLYLQYIMPSNCDHYAVLANFMLRLTTITVYIIIMYTYVYSYAYLNFESEILVSVHIIINLCLNHIVCQNNRNSCSHFNCYIHCKLA